MLPSKYTLVPPEELHPYVPDHMRDDEQVPIYPDFDPWHHTKEEDNIMSSYVAKGYYTSSKVNFESVSARSSIQDSLNKLTSQLVTEFGNIVRIREEEVNRVPALPENFDGTLFSDLSGPGFSLPTRVTLTDHKRELWLQELSLSYASLSKISKVIPHGLKKRQVLEQCYFKQIPIKRAMWLIKCCYSLEWKSMMMAKQQYTPSHKIKFKDYCNTIILKEWTDNFVFILEKLIFEMNTCAEDHIRLKVWKSEISYFLRLLGNCYTLKLINKEVFHHWLVEFFSKIEKFGLLPLTLHILTLFWDGLCHSGDNSDNSKPTFLVSKITETLLQKYQLISNSKSMINDQKYLINDIKKNNSIKKSILNTIRSLILKLFHEQSLEIFLFPNSNWDIYKPFLYEILNSNELNKDLDPIEIRKKLDLVTYRNESLKFNNHSMQKDLGSDPDHYFPDAGPDVTLIQLKTVDTEFTKLLDDNSVDYDWATYIDRHSFTPGHILQLLFWTVHPSRKDHFESIHLATKLLLLKINSTDGSQEYIFEDTIWLLIFKIAKATPEMRQSFVNLSCLYRLLNLLIGCGIIKVPTYIRKLISSGVLYLNDSSDKFFHCDLLINLNISPLTKNQYNMVLKNMVEYDKQYLEKYNFDKIIEISERIKDQIINNPDSKLDIDHYPLSVKLKVADWYLTLLCNKDLKPISKEDLLKNLEIFKDKLDCFHQFYKWLEFIVYHQLLEDLETMETLMDILLCYERTFSQFINDHILFIKTFIFIYSNVLKIRDLNAYYVTSFAPFWRFVIKKFPMAISVDDDLKNKISSVYESEKLKLEKLIKNKHPGETIYDSIITSRAKQSTWNFTEVFQTNLRQLLFLKNNSGEYKVPRQILLLLMGMNVRDYSKFISIYLKRKDFKIHDLKFLIDCKLLTLEQIRKVLGFDYLIQLININNENFSPYYERHRNHFLISNFQVILQSCEEQLSKYYSTFLRVLNQYGHKKNLLNITTREIRRVFENSHPSIEPYLDDLLNYGCDNNNGDTKLAMEDGDDNTLEEFDIVKPFQKLDFSNIHIFQAYTCFQIKEILNEEDEHETKEKLKTFFFDVLKISGRNCLFSQLFTQIFNVDVLVMILRIFEKDFFERRLTDSNDINASLLLQVETIAVLSQHIEGISTSIIPINEEIFSLICSSMENFLAMNNNDNGLQKMQQKFEIFLKIFTIHQKSIFDFIFNNTNQSKPEVLRNATLTNKLITNILKLFESISFDLGLKLMLYEILLSLKSYSIYTSSIGYQTENNNEIITRINHNNSINRGETGIIIPKELHNLPPFQVSSFCKDEETERINNQVKLGVKIPTKDRDDKEWNSKPHYFLYNKKSNTYDCQLQSAPYHHICNYQSDHDNSFNNSCLNLSLFNTVLDKRNPR